jgi:hypothetical protein
MNQIQRCSVALAALAVLVGTGYALTGRGIYGWTLFVLLPVLLGAVASWVTQPSSGAEAAGKGVKAVIIASASFLVFGVEGMICIAMTLPLAVPLGALGAYLVYRAQSSRTAAGGVAMFLVLPTATVPFDINARPPAFEVQSSIEIAATPEEVWKHVVSFSEMPEPDEWYFKAGLAYPTRARMEGAGSGAVRYCDFSTGPVVEPIEIWDEPRVLQFRVSENPAPMHEWSFYADVAPKHLHGYLVSKRGQFRLTPLADGRTLLEGTSWYQHGLWPAQYWRLWSDLIIHRIHWRVLSHIRSLAEH